MIENRILGGYRFVEIEHGDTLQVIAVRELGDAEKWTDLIVINDLVWPYITGDTQVAGPRVKLYGDTLIVPSTTAPQTQTNDPDSIYGTDVALSTSGALMAANGDFVLVSGRQNLMQAIRHRLATWLRDLLFHPLYGNGAFLLKGRGNTPTDGMLAAKYVSDALAQDARIRDVVGMTATTSGDALIIDGTAVPISGSNADFKTVV